MGKLYAPTGYGKKVDKLTRKIQRMLGHKPKLLGICVCYAAAMSIPIPTEVATQRIVRALKGYSRRLANGEISHLALLLPTKATEIPKQIAAILSKNTSIEIRYET